jgi:hypothetical protein
MATDHSQTSSSFPLAWMRNTKLNYTKVVWQGKIGPAFWTICSLISLAANVILIVILAAVGKQLFALKNLVSAQLIGGLYTNFVKMDGAHIVSEIQVQDTIRVVDEIPVVFNLPLSQDTTVVLTQDTQIPNTQVRISSSVLSINAPANITLPAGTPLEIRLDLVVPVSQTLPVTLDVPVNLRVPVDIPLNQTQLHEPFVGLRQVVEPYRNLLGRTPTSWRETPLCLPKTEWLCGLLLK